MSDTVKDGVDEREDRSDWHVGDIDLSKLPAEDVLPEHWFGDVKNEFHELNMYKFRKLITDFPNFQVKMFMRNRYRDEVEADVENFAEISRDLKGKFVLVQAMCEMGISRSVEVNAMLKSKEGIKLFEEGGINIRKFTEQLHSKNIQIIDGKLSMKVHEEWLDFNGLIFLVSPDSLNTGLDDLYKLYAKLNQLIDGAEVRNLNVMIMITTEWELTRE